jgi:hypothetical protein
VYIIAPILINSYMECFTPSHVRILQATASSQSSYISRTKSLNQSSFPSPLFDVFGNKSLASNRLSAGCPNALLASTSI